VTDRLKLRSRLKYLLPAPVELRDTGLYFAMVRTLPRLTHWLYYYMSFPTYSPFHSKLHVLPCKMCCAPLPACFLLPRVSPSAAYE
jgi:hypothetical protein